jgi:3-oxoacyl-[acyl-carrier-protein] synthase-3
LPSRIVTNAELATIVDTSDEWISTRTGIKQRRVLSGEETMLGLSAEASVAALKNAKTDAAELDLIIAATLQGDHITPSLACIVQSAIGANCPAFDINAACSGFVYALEVARSFIVADPKKYKKILIVCCEAMSKHADWTDRATCVLFGDAAGACVVGAGEQLKYLGLTAVGDDKRINQPTATGNSPFRPKTDAKFVYLNGQEVYKYAQFTIQREIEKALQTLDIGAESIDTFVLHQANKRIIDAVRENMGLPEHKFPVNIDKYGNTSAATIPVLLYELSEAGKIKRGERLLLVAFGGGMASGAAVIEWD